MSLRTATEVVRLKWKWSGNILPIDKAAIYRETFPFYLNDYFQSSTIFFAHDHLETLETRSKEDFCNAVD